MSRLIDKNALMAKLGITQNCSVCEHGYTPLCTWKPNVVDVCKEICEAPTIEPEQRWIPVSEKLPDKADFYLVSSKSKTYPDDPDEVYTHVCFYDCCEWACTNRTVTAWMPLPEPYREESR